MLDYSILKQRQSNPLEVKIEMSKIKIREWYEHWGGEVYVSFSGGKDSTVLLHLVRSIYPDVPAVFMNTGLEYPENRDFVKTIDNVIVLHPKMPFKKVIEKYGYPIISKETSEKIYDIRNTKSDKQRNRRLYGDEKGNGKISKKWLYLVEAPFKISHRCCWLLKKNPVKNYEKKSNRKPIVGIMAYESSLRKMSYLKTGCNNFKSGRPMSIPLSFWLEKDIWAYLKKFNLPYSKIYDKGYSRTGCMFCMFGVNQEKFPNRFQKMKITHPKLYNYCINKLGINKILDYINVPY